MFEPPQPADGHAGLGPGGSPRPLPLCRQPPVPTTRVRADMTRIQDPDTESWHAVYTQFCILKNRSRFYVIQLNVKKCLCVFFRRGSVCGA